MSARLASTILRRGARSLVPAGTFAQELRRNILPQNTAGWAMSLAPDIIGAAASTAYGGLPAGAESLVLGAGGSVGGRFAGSALAYGLSHATGASPRQMRINMQQAAGLGDMVGSMGLSMFGPRPLTDSMRQAQQEELIAAQGQHQNILYNQLAGSPMIQDYNALLSHFAGGYG